MITCTSIQLPNLAQMLYEEKQGDSLGYEVYLYAMCSASSGSSSRWPVPSLLGEPSTWCGCCTMSLPNSPSHNSTGGTNILNILNIPWHIKHLGHPIGWLIQTIFSILWLCWHYMPCSSYVLIWDDTWVITHLYCLFFSPSSFEVHHFPKISRLERSHVVFKEIL